MKNIFLLLSFSIIISCSSDDNAANQTSVESITGLWRVESVTADGFTFDYVDCETTVDGGVTPLIGIYDFKADGNVDISSLCMPEDGILSTTYGFENNVLSLVLYDVEWRANVTALSGDKMKFEFYWSSDDESPFSNQMITVRRTTPEEVAAGGW